MVFVLLKRIPKHLTFWWEKNVLECLADDRDARTRKYTLRNTHTLRARNGTHRRCCIVMTVWPWWMHAAANWAFERSTSTILPFTYRRCYCWIPKDQISRGQQTCECGVCVCVCDLKIAVCWTQTNTEEQKNQKLKKSNRTRSNWWEHFNAELIVLCRYLFPMLYHAVAAVVIPLRMDSWRGGHNSTKNIVNTLYHNLLGFLCSPQKRLPVFLFFII